MIEKKPAPPCYAVIFTSLRNEEDNAYEKTAKELILLASKQEGFIGVDSAREEVGITVSFWRDMKAIQLWRDNAEHLLAKKKGQSEWYKSYSMRISKVEDEYRRVS